MEKISFLNSRGKKIVANFWASNKHALVIIAHGFTRDKSELGKFDKIATELNKAGFAVLAFDFTGHGESDDEEITIKKEIDDMESALLFAKALGYKKIGLFGHSLGGYISLKSYNPKVKAMVLIAPVTDKPKYDLNKKYSPTQIEELKEKGVMVKTRSVGIRKKFLIHKEFFEDRVKIKPTEFLNKINCPVLAIHGDKDKIIPITDSKTVMKYLPKESKLEIIENEEHNFEKSTDKVSKLAKEWFLEKMGLKN